MKPPKKPKKVPAPKTKGLTQAEWDRYEQAAFDAGRIAMNKLCEDTLGTWAEGTNHRDVIIAATLVGLTKLFSVASLTLQHDVARVIADPLLPGQILLGSMEAAHNKSIVQRFLLNKKSKKAEVHDNVIRLPVVKAP
jgi:hypothetical protein